MYSILDFNDNSTEDEESSTHATAPWNDNSSSVTTPSHSPNDNGNLVAFASIVINLFMMEW